MLLASRDVNDHKCPSLIKLIRYRKKPKTFETVQVLIVWRIDRLQKKLFCLLIKLNGTKCLFFWGMHKTKQIKLQFQNFQRSKWNKNSHKLIRSEQKKNINICKGNNLLINKNETKQSAYISGSKKRRKSKR